MGQDTYTQGYNKQHKLYQCVIKSWALDSVLVVIGVEGIDSNQIKKVGKRETKTCPQQPTTMKT